jgi:hydrogenase nickel incorporation protein HypA/HybF
MRFNPFFIFLIRFRRGKMHEYSIMTDIVNAALATLENYDVESVDTVFLEVGELTFLNPVQLRFCYGVLTENNLLSGSKLEITEKKAGIECPKCGYKGVLKERPEEDHIRIPRLSCPKCDGEVNIISGRECIIRSIKMNQRDREEHNNIQ